MRLSDKFLGRLGGSMLPVVERMATARFKKDPICEQPLAEQEHYEQLYENTRNLIYPEVDEFETVAGYSIDKDWLDNLALLTQITVKKEKLSYAHGRILYSAVRKYAERRDKNETIVVLETGTARGFSALCMMKAIMDASKTGVVHTFDVIPHDVSMYWNCINDLKVGKTTRRELLHEYRELTNNIFFHCGDTAVNLPNVSFPRVNVGYLDGAHTFEHVMAEFRCIEQIQSEGDLLIFDDYSSLFPGVVEAVDKICSENGYDPHPIHANEQRGYVVAKKL